MRILAIDVGTGTQDIMLWNTDEPIENALQLIVPSPTLRVAQQVRAATAARRAIVLRGVLMGGGPCHWAVNDHLAAGFSVAATPEAARTFDDDLSKIEASGIRLIDDAPDRGDAVTITMRDLDLDAIAAALQAFGVDAAWDMLAVAVFDHGNAPPDVSDRTFRFAYLADRLRDGGWLTDLAFDRDDVPESMTRLQAVVATAPPDVPLVVMDTAPAAILGALDDPAVRALPEAIVANIGNFHALAFSLTPTGDHHAINGLFEHHTGELNEGQLAQFLERLANGTITNDEIFGSQGHGALVFDRAPLTDARLVTTGPRQRKLTQWRGATPYRAVPHGDMMLAGCFGLVRAVAGRFPHYQAAIEAGLR